MTKLSAKGSAPTHVDRSRFGSRHPVLAGAVLVCVALVLGISRGGTVAAAPSVTVADSGDDAAPRRTDPGGDGPFDSDLHRLIELREMIIGKWAPDDPEADIFVGTFANSGKFFRLDLVLDKLVNPPGPTGLVYFEPFRYGDHPIFGFVEIDMDQDVETGGELNAPQYRYLGNIVRFGGKPEIADFQDRVALNASAFDGDFLTAPFVDRHGEEFHLALLGSEFTSGDIEEVLGDSDTIFEEGETWQINAPFFHRAHGYEPFSLATGGAHAGEYAPACTLQFQHDAGAEVTYVSLVFPLKNQGAGLMVGEPPEPDNGDPSDHASVKEGLVDLHDSAVFLDSFPTGLPEEAIITEWMNKDPSDFLNPTQWEITALLGTSYTVMDPAGEYFVWTDVVPDVRRGDVNGDDEIDLQDQQLIQQYIADYDSADGLADGRAELVEFATDFSVFDVNHDGVVEDLDVMLVSLPGDLNDDGDVDLSDFASFSVCFSGSGVPYSPLECGLADMDADGDVDLRDMRRLVDMLTGPGTG